MSNPSRKWMRVLKWSLGVPTGLCLLAVCVLLVWMHSRKETPPAGSTPSRARLWDPSFAGAGDKALRLLQQAQSDRHFPSVAMAVGVDGRLVWAGAVGYEEVSTARAATVESRYYVLSIAKLFTTIAFGRLVEEGKLSLNETFSARVPEFPRFDQDFTLAQLQRHQAGVRHWKLGDVINRHWYGSVHEAAMDLAGDKLLFKPGSRTSYSTPGYTLLALAMEKADAEEYSALMNRLVFDPAGMHDIILDRAGRPTTHIVTPYFVSGSTMVRIPDLNVSDRWAGGGYLSSPADIVRFGNAILEGGMLSTRFRAKLLRQQDGITELPQAFSEEKSDLGLRLTGGGTGWTGRASLSIYPQSRIVVAVASNTRPADDHGAGIDQDSVARLFQRLP